MPTRSGARASLRAPPEAAPEYWAHAQTLKLARPVSLAFWQGFGEHGSGAS